MRPLSAAAVIGMAVWLTSGCALRGADRGIRSAAESPERLPADSLETFMQKVRSLSARPAKPDTPLQKIEQRDTELAEALRQLAVFPTGERHRKVAERYRALGVPDMAYRHFNRALAMNERDAAAHDGLARVWRDWGFPHLALGDAHRAVYYAPASAAAHNTLGTVFQALGQDDPARLAYERATRLEPRAVYALSNLCYLSFLHGQFDRALATCNSALAVDPAFMAARNNLALTHAATGRFDLARAEFMDAGEEALGFFNMGIVHLAARNYALAAAAFDAASRANPTMSIARARASQARRLERAAAPGTSGDPK